MQRFALPRFAGCGIFHEQILALRHAGRRALSLCQRAWSVVLHRQAHYGGGRICRQTVDPS
jgi:hypothetical protein